MARFVKARPEFARFPLLNVRPKNWPFGGGFTMTSRLGRDTFGTKGDIAVSMRTSPKSEVLAPDIQTPAGGMKATRIAHFRRGNRLDFCVEKSR